MSGNASSQFAHYPFGRGMTQFADPRLLDPPDVVEARNVRIPKPGQYEKRAGTVSAYSSIVAPSWLSLTLGTSAGAITSLGETIVRCDEKSISVASSARGAMLFRGWTPVGLPRVRTIWGTVGDAQPSGTSQQRSQFSQVDCAAGTTGSGKRCFAVAYYAPASEETHLIVYDAERWVPINITDAIDGGTCDPVVVAADYHWPRLLWLGDHLYFAMMETGTNSVEWRRINTSTWEMEYLILLANGDPVREDATGPRAYYDLVKLSDTRFAMAYQFDGTNALVVDKYAETGVRLSTVTSAEAANPVEAIGISGTTGESVWVTFARQATGQTRITCINESTWAERASFPVNGPVVLRDTPLASTSTRVSSTSTACFWGDYDSTMALLDQHEVRGASCTTSAVVDATWTINMQTILAGKAFTTNGRVFVPVAFGAAGQGLTQPIATSAAQWSVGVFEFLPTRTDGVAWPMLPNVLAVPLVAEGLALHCVASTIASPFCPGGVWANGSELTFAWPELHGFVGGGIIREGLDAISFDTTKATHMRGAKIGGALYAGGLVIDESGVSEHGFLHRPDILETADNGVGNIANGTYQYRAIYVATTRAGLQIRSTPSQNESHTVAGGPKKVQVTIPALATGFDFAPHVAEYRQNYVELYRSTNAAQSGPFYFVGRKTMTTGATAYTMDDNIDDTDIVKNPQLYTGDISTQRSVMANVPVPTFVHTIAHKDRVIGLGPDRQTVYACDKLVANEVSAVHSEVTMRVDDELECLFSLDELMGAMSRTAIYVQDGDGPSNRYPGADSDYRGFRRIASDVGCVDAGSLCLGPDGIYFRSANGLNILTRGGQVVPFGLEVQDELDANTRNTSIVIHPSQRWLYVACDNGTTGVRLVYDYRLKSWTKDLVRAGAVNDRLVSQCIHNGAVHSLAASNGGIWKEDSSTYLDNGNWVTRSVTFANFKGSGPIGWQGITHFHFLGEYHTPHGMTATADYDYGTTKTESWVWFDAELTAFPTSPVLQWRRTLQKKEGQSVRVTIQDAAPTVGAVGSGRAATWIAYAFDFEQHKDGPRLPAVQQR